MVVSISLVLLFGAALAFLLRSRTLGAGSALIAVLFGFYLDKTGAAAPITHLIGSIVTALSHIR